MATFTISVPDEIKNKMDMHPDINWAEYIKQRFEIRIKELAEFEKMKSSGRI